MTIKVEPRDHTEPTEMAASDRLQQEIEEEPINREDEQNGDSYQLTDLDAFQQNNNLQKSTSQHWNTHRDTSLFSSTQTTTTTTSQTTSLSPSPPPSPELETPSSPESFLSEIDIDETNSNEQTTTTTIQLIRANNETHPDDNINHSLQGSQPTLRKRSNSSHENYHHQVCHHDRAGESRLTEQQSEHLNKLIASIVEGNDFNEFKQLVEKLSRGAKRNLLNVYVDGRTALHYSLIYGRSLKWCKQLIVNGANPNLTNRAGWHPIHLAAYNSSRETMLYLIDCLSN